MNSQSNHVAEKLRQLEVTCQRDGVPVTPQRRAVLEVLAARDDHPTAEEVYKAVKERLPDVARATVYRVLDTLVRLGIAVRAFHPDAAARFDAIDSRHHHLYCVSCRRLIDLPDAHSDDLAQLAEIVRDHEAHDYSIYFRGVCADCRASGSADAHAPLRRDATNSRDVNPSKGDDT